ncbi:MAG: NADH-quinone oxidoreductase subunit NuoG [Cyclobacteriaceae bacterium]|nr:NADH-quinone oxidoreductase subunit NuoG [Cyclobacteriaceae bacterium]
MVTIYIDHKPYTVNPGKNLLETCLTLGFDLPYFCWHPALGSVGACRQCAIKMFRDGDDKQGRLVMSCMEPVANNQRISIMDPMAVDFREGVIEWLMTNHPHDCAVCDEGGSCHLQDMTVMTGHAYRRFTFKKRTHVNQDLGPFINHEMNRCIQCYRCVRFYKDYAGGEDLDVFASKSNVYFGRSEPGILESEFSGNLSEVCPTGVFTDKTLKQHYTRKWDLTMAPTICQHCSLGCNIIAGERYGDLRMIANRYHGEINGYFICDRGRFGYEFVNSPNRILQPQHMGQPIDSDKAINEISELIKQSNVIGIGSPRASLESNYALKKLVGDSNFYKGVSKQEQALTELAVSILKEGTVRTPSMKETEKADAVFILGEDLTNTAPMLALAVRQSVKQQPMQEVNKLAVPEWNDAAAREIIQDKKGPLFVATVAETKLDTIASKTFRAAPQDIARLGFAVANLIDSSAPNLSNLSEEEKTLAELIAKSLLASERPVIISGTSCQSDSVLKAAANVASALQKRNKNTGIVLTLPECNSVGLSVMGGLALHDAFEKVKNSKADAVIILENDLYRHGSAKVVDAFLSKCKSVIVIDHSQHATTTKGQWLIPAGTFAEADGTLVNNEGRAQRFFQVYEKANVKESWRWLSSIGSAAGNAIMQPWKNFDSITAALSQEEKNFNGIEKVSLSADFRMHDGQRVPREPHRYSGRTSMLANVAVSEPKPPEDLDSGMSYTMEGTRALPPSSMIPFFWSPGWNSVQSVNKYQEEVGAALRGGDPGIRLFEASGKQSSYFTNVPEKFKPVENKLWGVPIHHIFGSEELSAKGAAVSNRVPLPYLLLSKEDAAKLKLTEGEAIEFEIDEQGFKLPVKLCATISTGVAGLPVGLPGLSFIELSSWGVIRSLK